MRSRRLMPLWILVGALGLVFLLFMAKRTPEDRVRQSLAPLVRVVSAQPEAFQYSVVARGSVEPRTESDLIPQVSGELIAVSPALVPGGFFEAGDVLARIDQADYKVDREAARAQVARARSEFRRADKELRRQRQLADQSVSSQSRIDDAENAFRVAEASLREAEARLERAERDLARTEIKAPYRGLVRSEQVDLGQFVNRGTPIATIYAVDYAEVRLPVPDRELAYLDLPGLTTAAIQDSGSESEKVEMNPSGARVELSAEFAGEQHVWQGALVRTEAELDPRSRMVRLVARIPDPFGLESPRSAPLAIGLFVNARIEGRQIDRAFVLPRNTLRPGDQVYVIDEAGRMEFRDVEVLRTERDRIIIGSGLEPGERVCTSPLQAALDGMQVRVLEGDADGEGKTEGEPPDPVKTEATR